MKIEKFQLLILQMHFVHWNHVIKCKIVLRKVKKKTNFNYLSSFFFFKFINFVGSIKHGKWVNLKQKLEKRHTKYDIAADVKSECEMKNNVGKKHMNIKWKKCG